jgi:hypothetical protein
MTVGAATDAIVEARKVRRATRMLKSLATTFLEHDPEKASHRT